MKQTQTSAEQLLPILEILCNQNGISLESCREEHSLNLNTLVQQLDGKVDNQLLTNLRQALA